MSETTPQSPIRRFRAPKLCVSVWKRTEERNGQSYNRFSIAFQKRYFSKEQQDYCDTNTLFPEDLPRLCMLLEKAFEYTMLREESAEGQGDELSDGDASVG